jgi:ATP-dependent Clp protease ATP-binding subunit ClpA
MSREMATLILNKKISELNNRLAERNVTISLTAEANEWLLNNGFSAKYGAREIERVITHNLKPLLVNEILFGKLVKKGVAEISVVDNKLALTITK